MEAVLFSNQIEHIRKIPKDLPLFFVSGEQGPVGNLGKGVKQAYSLYKQAGLKDITYKLYPNDRHEILNETDRAKVYADIYAWMKIRLRQTQARRYSL